MNLLGLTTMGESAAAFLRDGRVLFAAEEERYSRVKHHVGFPHQAMSDGLARTGLTLEDIDHVCHYWQPWILGHRIGHTLSVGIKGLDLFAARAKRGAKQVRGHYLPMFFYPFLLRRRAPKAHFTFHYVEHHLSHAASAFFTSPFDEAAILSYDGTGESTTTLFAHGRGTTIDVLKRIKLPHSIGQFYSAFTNFLGFDMFAGDEYKVMGMAAWGKPIYADFLLRNVLIPTGDGGFRLDITFLDHHLAKHRRYPDRAIDVLGAPRQPGQPILQRHFDIAASVQAATERVTFHMLAHLAKLTGTRNLCVTGGVALNSLLNGKIEANSPFQHLWFHPASNDAGGALGAALYVWHSKLHNPRGPALDHAYLGPSYDLARCRAAAQKAGLTVHPLTEEQTIAKAADLLAQGQILGWFMGEMEWGPRALGHRSFLADPRRAEMKDLINEQIKLREPFRPFAPSLIEEASVEYFGRPIQAPFMIQVFDVLPEKRAEIPAVVHADGTARPQTVARATNPRYWKLISEFGRRTGVPLVLNTSFNVQEPIVNTPEDAVATFKKTGVQHLFLETLHVTKPSSESAR